MTTTEYGYGHTKEAAAVVRQALNDELADVKQQYQLTISVRKADSGYGGPRVSVSTPQIQFDRRYEYIVDENGQPANSGRLVNEPVSSFKYGRPHMSATLVTPEVSEKLNARISKVLSKFGRDNDDAMTDYFDNTSPLFYGVTFRAAVKPIITK